MKTAKMLKKIFYLKSHYGGNSGIYMIHKKEVTSKNCVTSTLNMRYTRCKCTFNCSIIRKKVQKNYHEITFHKKTFNKNIAEATENQQRVDF